MKNLILLISLFFCFTCFSQDPNPALFQNWYLRFVQSNDLSTPYTVSQVQPHIGPTLTISNTLAFTGQGACNSFSGSFSGTTDYYWQSSSFSSSNAVCSSQNQSYFEDSYFNFLQSAGWYQIMPEGSGLVLIMNNPIFGTAIFQNFPLKASAFDLEKVTLHPNPASSVVYLDSAVQLEISKIQIINSLGQNVKTINDNFEAINVGDLATGIYILKIDTEFGTVSRKIIRE